MTSYLGDEQNNPILNFIQAQSYPASGGSLEIPNLQNAYKLWNGAKLGHIPNLTSIEAQTWFGHSLFTTNVKMCVGYLKLTDISHIYSSNPTMPRVPTPVFASYESPIQTYPEPLKQLKRYDVINGFFSDLMGALDVISVGIAYLYDFKRLRTDFGIPERFIPRDRSSGIVDLLRLDFSSTIKFLREINNVAPNPNINKPINLIQVIDNEGLFTINTTTHRTNCSWYETLKLQRNYHTHVGFPLLYVENGELKLSADPRDPSPASSLTDSVPTLCDNLFGEVHHFMGKIYESAWADLGHLLPP